MLRRIGFIFVLGICGLQNSKAEDAVKMNDPLKIEFPVEKYQLTNGLTVLLHQDRTVPVVSYNTWFRVGSRNEQVGYTGMAHLFEHMMFKGAQRYTNKEYDRVLQANGGTNNAFTTRDYTAYYIVLPSSKLELAVDMESDRMESLQITPENLKSEREVVKEERRYRVENDVMGFLDELKFALLFKVHPYRWPVIGWMSDLDNITVEKCREFFSTYYSATNAVISLAGDFDIPAAKAMIEKYYGHLPRHNIPALQPVQEPAQTAERRQLVSRDVQNEYTTVNFVVPEAGHPDSFALDVLANILTEGGSSRLYRKLVYENQIASAVRAGNQGLREAGVFEIDLVMHPKVKTERALKIMQSEIAQLSTTPVRTSELERAKNQISKSYIDSLKTIHGKAQALAMNEVLLGDYRRLFTDLEEYQKVTAEQVRDSAKKYLQPSHATLVIASPKATAAAVGQAQKKGSAR